MSCEVRSSFDNEWSPLVPAAFLYVRGGLCRRGERPIRSSSSTAVWLTDDQDLFVGNPAIREAASVKDFHYPTESFTPIVKHIAVHTVQYRIDVVCKDPFT